MKLSCQYNEIKNLILRGLESQGTTKSKLKIYFKEIQANKVNGDFKRACVWVGFQLNGFWRDIILENYTKGINDDHIKTFYYKFFKDLNFNEAA